MKKILPRVLESHGIGRQLEARYILEEANKTLLGLWGESRARHCQMAAFRDGVLTVRVLAPAALQTIRMEEARFMNELNRRLGERKVLQLSYRREGF